MRDALFFGMVGALLMAGCGLAYAWLMPAGTRQTLLVEIAIGEGGALPPATGLLMDQLGWFVTHRFDLLSVWVWLAALGAVVGTTEGFYGRLVWRRGGSSVLSLIFARLTPFIAASAVVAAFCWPWPLHFVWLGTAAWALGVLLPWSVIRGVPVW